MFFGQLEKRSMGKYARNKNKQFYRNHSLTNLDELTAKKVKRDGEIVVNEIRKE